MATFSGDILVTLKPGINKIFGNYPIHAGEWKHFLKEEASNKREEDYLQTKLIGFGQIKPEGVNGYLDPGVRANQTIKILNQTVSNGFQISEEAVEDNQYTNEFPQKTKALKNAMLATKDLLATMFLTDNNVVYDGQPLFSNAHTTDTGTLSNLLTADPSTASIDLAQQALSQWTDQAGLPSLAMFKKAIIPSKFRFNLSQICGSEYTPENANNGINAIVAENILPERFTVNHYLALLSTAGVYPWFITTNKDGWIMQKRTPLKFSNYMDEAAGILTIRCKERYGIGAADWRGGFGTNY